MYWHQKGAMVADNQSHLDSLTASISNFLANKQLRQPPTILQSSNQGVGAACILIVDYVNQTDADQAWTFVKNAQNSNWIIAPSFVTYAAMNDDGSVNAVIERINW